MTDTTEQAAHHELGASGAYRWVECPGSVAAQRGKRDETSVYADEGTEAHALSEITLNQWSGAQPTEDNTRELQAWAARVKTKKYDNVEMVRETTKYVEYVRDLCADDPTRLTVEQRISLSPAVPGGFSTADAIVVTPNDAGMTARLDVADLKFGKGKQVFAENNPQLRLYAYGVITHLIDAGKLDDLFDDFDDIEVVMHICQPRLDHFDCETMTVAALLAWIDTNIIPAVARIESGEDIRKPGEHCQFCKAEATCKARAQQVTESLNDDWDDFIESGPDVSKPGELTDDEIGKILQHKKALESWLNAVKEHAYQTIEAGGEVPGWKLVAGNNARKWIDEDEALEAFKAQRALKQDEYAPRKLISPAQADKVLPAKSKLRDMIKTERNRPSLVEASNKKAALVFEPIDSMFD